LGLRVDYETNTLELDRDLSWAAGTGVAMQYGGDQPDIGAFETALGAVGRAPEAPTGLRVIP
jgi:hypothetical protein